MGGCSKILLHPPSTWFIWYCVGGSLSLYIVCGWGGWTKHNSVFNSRGGFLQRGEVRWWCFAVVALYNVPNIRRAFHPSSIQGNANSICSCRYRILIGIKIVFINFFVFCNIATKMGMDFILWMLLLYLWADKLFVTPAAHGRWLDVRLLCTISLDVIEN